MIPWARKRGCPVAGTGAKRHLLVLVTGDSVEDRLPLSSPVGCAGQECTPHPPHDNSFHHVSRSYPLFRLALPLEESCRYSRESCGLQTK